MKVKTFIILHLILDIFGDYATSESVPDSDSEDIDYPAEEDLNFVSTPKYYGSTYNYGRYRTTRSSNGYYNTRKYRGSTRKYSYDYFETTKSPNFDSTRRYRETTRRNEEDSYSTRKPSYLNTYTENEFKISSMFPYFDLTETLDSKNETELKNALNVTRHIYYSTDSLISNVLDLSWIPSLINETLSNDGEENPEFYLMMSFRIVQNKSSIDWRYMQDVLKNPNIVYNLEEHDNLKLLRKYLHKVVLDFQVEYPGNEYFESQEYMHKYRISFSKHAKKILTATLGPESVIPVGIIYSENQISKDQILRESEIKHADFQIISVTCMPLIRMPLDLYVFEDYISTIVDELRLQSKSSEGVSIDVDFADKISFMLVWKQASETIEHMPKSELKNATIKVYQSVGKEDLIRFETLVQQEVPIGYYKIGVISGAQFEVRNLKPFDILVRRPGKIYQEILPSLHVQETDVSPCQLREMLSKISTLFEYLAVDEYTWNTLIRYYNEFSDTQLMKGICDQVSNLNLSTNMLLFASSGIGKHWNYTSKIFESLLWDNPRVGEMNLTTVIFSAVDIIESMQKTSIRGSKSSGGIGITKFVKSWKKANMSGIGCLVDVSREAHLGLTDAIVKTTGQNCAPILEESDMIIWDFKIYGDLTSACNFTFNVDRENLKMVLVRMLVAREMFLERYPEKEVVFSINTDNLEKYSVKNLTSEEKIRSEIEDIKFQRTLFAWARSYGVKLMFKPAYDLRNPGNGYFVPPKSNGEQGASTFAYSSLFDSEN